MNDRRFSGRLFTDRHDAGRKLAARLSRFKALSPLVIAIPRGGIPVAYEVANSLAATMDVLVVRKIGAPENPEYGIGAVTEDGSYWIDHEAASALGISPEELEDAIARETGEIRRRVELLRGERPLASFNGRTVIIVDDGLATGVTARVACRAARRLGAQRVVLAAPVAAPSTVRSLRDEADHIVCPEQPEFFESVGSWYEDFSQLSDEEAMTLIENGRSRQKSEGARARDATLTHTVLLEPALTGDLTVPKDAKGIVIFAHGSGSSRKSPRNQFVARMLNEIGLSTLLFDLMTEDESLDEEKKFDIPFLADRLRGAMSWVRQQPRLADLPVGLFGASTGAAAALWAASEPDAEVAAIVSRGGRPDLAFNRLRQVRAPTLLLVGGNDPDVLTLNRLSLTRFPDKATLTVISSATHLFEEPGMLEQVAEEAGKWFSARFAEYARASQEQRKAA